jgi:hypothetical protein
MATKKTIPAKAGAKTPSKKPAKETTKKAAPKKTAAAKPKAKPASIRRPDPNLPPDASTIEAITNSVLEFVTQLETHTANLRALDRQRHNGVGLKRLGFIEAAFRISSKFPQYFPHWLDTPKFQSDLDLFNAIRSLVEVCRSLEEKAWNINVESSDMVYTDALEYYSQVQDASKRRIDAAESLYDELKTFFKHSPMESGEPSEKKVKRDVNALLRGKKDGEVIIKNIKPKTAGGTREVTDETWKDAASFKETDEGRLTE